VRRGECQIGTGECRIATGVEMRCGRVIQVVASRSLCTGIVESWLARNVSPGFELVDCPEYRASSSSGFLHERLDGGIAGEVFICLVREQDKDELSGRFGDLQVSCPVHCFPTHAYAPADRVATLGTSIGRSIVRLPEFCGVSGIACSTTAYRRVASCLTRCVVSLMALNVGRCSASSPSTRPHSREIGSR